MGRLLWLRLCIRDVRVESVGARVRRLPKPEASGGVQVPCPTVPLFLADARAMRRLFRVRQSKALSWGASGR